LAFAQKRFSLSDRYLRLNLRDVKVEKYFYEIFYTNLKKKLKKLQPELFPLE
jgi:hypothetical protein